MRNILIAAALTASVALGDAGGAFAAESDLSFTVLRDGSEIGSHEIHISEAAGKTTVKIETDVAVKLAFVTLYNFDHEGHEVWENGQLVSYASKTDDDGKEKSLNAKRDGGDLAVNGSAGNRRAALTVVPASLWNMATVSQTHLLNTLDGSDMAIMVKDLGEEAVKVMGKDVMARHYAISGDLQRELWYDAGGRLVKVRFAASDGTDIQYVLM